MIWLKFIGIGLAIVLLLWGSLAMLGAWRWPQRIAEVQRRLAAAEQALPDTAPDPAALGGLPAPVARYLRAVLPPGQPHIRKVAMAHEGQFNMGEGADNWKPFTSTQQVTMARPGFVWDGRIAMAPGIPVRVIDAYVAGEGLLLPAILGLIPLTRLEGGGAIAEGELLRWLAETPWYPTALLPGGAVTWDAIDDHSARATVTDGAMRVDLTFTFGPDDLVSAIRADARSRTVAGQMIPTPWEGRWWGYERRDGMLVPTAGEVAWVLPEGRKPYWQGRVTALHYD
jgi:hypothetical protein